MRETSESFACSMSTTKKMKYRLQPIFLFLLTAVVMLGTSEKVDMSVIVSLPHHLIPGLETLAGASIAIEEINTNSGILSEQNLQMIVFDGVKDKDVLQEFINLTFYQSSKQVVAVCGFLSPKIISILSRLARQQGVLITTPAQSFVTVSEDIVALYSPHAMATALLHFVHRMDWNRVGLISQNTDSYFFRVTEKLLQMSESNGIVISPYVEVFHIESAVQDIVTRSSRVIIVNLNAEKTVQLLCRIHANRLVWPDYAWIFHSYKIEHILSRQANCTLEEVINGIFMIEGQLPPELSEELLVSEKNSLQYLSTLSTLSRDYNATFSPNPLAIIMYELIWQTAIALNNTCRHSSDCRTHQMDPLVPYGGSDVWSMNVFHVKEQSWLLVGTVYGNSSAASVSLNESIVDTVSLNELTVVSVDDPPLGYRIAVALMIAFLAAYVTIMLILYILLRKQPEVKATSFSLSLFMFGGCYLILLYSSFINFFYSPTFNSVTNTFQNAVCITRLWTFGAGLPLPLMIATLFMKIARVYYIFNKAVKKVGHCCSDLVLMGCVLLIISPTILVNLIWTVADPYHSVLEYRVHNVYVYITKDCVSKYSAYWLGVLCAYTLVLTIALATVAVMTRNVRLRHFKDTKKVSILVFILSTVTVMTYSYWIILNTFKSPQYSVSTLIHLSHSVVVISYQSLLFLPKVYPPLIRIFFDKPLYSNTCN